MSVNKNTLTVLLFAVIAAVAANSVSTDEFECPMICPALYAPVCASDGFVYKEFANSCDLKAGNCRRSRSALTTYAETDMDWCTTELVQNLHEKLNSLDLQKPECLKPCAMIYAPVCVSNGKYRGLVSNKCVMEAFNCALSGTAAENLFKVLRSDTC